MLKLYSPQPNYKTNKILVTANFANVEIIFHPVDYKYTHSKQLIKKYPNASLPALQISHEYLFGTSTIIRYIAQIGQNQLKATTEYQKSLVDQWIDFSDYQIQRSVAVLYLMIFGLVEYDEQKYRNNKKNVCISLKMVENYLRTRTFLVGNQVTLADVSLASNLFFAYKLIFDKKFQKDYVNLTRWFSHISSLIPFKNVFGKCYLCEQQYKITNSKSE